ncbi:hypothetical protein L810_8692 [Burkholderia sp. AU4i]|nr:hypothetical protein L810_8692 [Burkholderia sp. AU4i]MDW9233834.1 putative lipoprotein [Burkholderia cepacia]
MSLYAAALLWFCLARGCGSGLQTGLARAAGPVCMPRISL